MKVDHKSWADALTPIAIPSSRECLRNTLRSLVEARGEIIADMTAGRRGGGVSVMKLDYEVVYALDKVILAVKDAVQE